MSERAQLVRALRILTDEFAAMAARHPSGHLLTAGNENLDLHVSLPLHGEGARLERAAETMHANIEREIERLVRHRSIVRPGRVFCLRCDASSCMHASPDDPRAVFGGYTQTGVPRFVDLGTWLQERGDARVETFYARSPQPLAVVSHEEELRAELLPAFHDKVSKYRLHGQVATGWYRLENGGLRPEPFTVTIQVVSLARSSARRSFGLNVIGCGPSGRGLSDLGSRWTPAPWSAAVGWAQTVLEQITRPGRRGRAHQDHVAQRIEGLLEGLARRIVRRERAAQRRTKHAESRHASGARPTRMAVSDLAQAGPERMFFDARAKTLVVLGDRGRTHVFSAGGKLVTSIRYPPASIAAKKRRGEWKPASREQIAAFRLEFV